VLADIADKLSFVLISEWKSEFSAFDDLRDRVVRYRESYAKNT
jgi:hypothetical protein